MRSRKGAGFTLVELLVVIAIISVIAGMLIPTLLKSRGEVFKLQCKNRLRELGRLSVLYVDQGASRFFPLAPGNPPLAYQSLQLLANHHKDLKGEMFVCPESRDVEAVPAEEGGIVELSEDNVSYAWTIRRLMQTDSASRALSSDNSIKDPEREIDENHAAGMNVLSLDTSVAWVQKEKLGDRDLPQGLGP
ncbi:MAG: prepilin-type N-terminal cleavage/methylation domain-containing protein [Planctomycetes bacterium]|nr:prepilin-type N-terminal cleavage/methylation domain-containing protein [Planctomycetota bacterium]